MNQFENNNELTNSYHYNSYNLIEVNTVINDSLVKLGSDVYDLSETLAREIGLSKKSSKVVGVLVSSYYSYETGKRVNPKIGSSISILYNLLSCLEKM